MPILDTEASGPRYTATIKRANISVTPMDAGGSIRYYVDGIPTTTQDLTSCQAAIDAVPLKIGDPYVVSSSAGKSLLIKPDLTAAAGDRTVHTLRVFGLSSGCEETANATKWFVDVELRSPPTVQESSGSALLQEKTELYLVGGTPGSPKQKQIQLRYSFPPNIPAILNLDGSETPPVTTLPVAGSVSKYFYTETYSLSGTFYQDQIDLVGLAAMKANVGKINSKNFRNNNSGDDSRCWICSGVDEISNDNGMSYRITASWIFNPLSWDPIVTQRNLQTGAPLILSSEDIAAATKFLTSSLGIPNPNPTDPAKIPASFPGGGIGRFPIYFSTDMNDLASQIKSASTRKPGDTGTTFAGDGSGGTDGGAGFPSGTQYQPATA